MTNSIHYPSTSGIEVFLKGEEILRQVHQDRELHKIGNLRIGNAGCMVSPTACIGACPQTTLARFLGYQLPASASQSYFDGGIDNESVWETNISAAGTNFLREEEIPVIHTMACGTKITGRPDIVLGDTIDGAFHPTLMIELKACQATNSSAQKLYLEKPDAKHLIQAATYGMFLGCPATLIYTSNVSGGISNYFTKREAGKADATFGKIEFPLCWRDGTLYYKKGTEEIKTIVTQQGILDYYANISKMAREKNHSLLYQDMVDVEGNMLPYDPNKYNDILNLVDISLTFEDWCNTLEIVTKQEYLIKYKTKKGTTPWYEIIHPTYDVEPHRYFKVDKFIKKFDTLAAARKFITQQP